MIIHRDGPSARKYFLTRYFFAYLACLRLNGAIPEEGQMMRWIRFSVSILLLCVLAAGGLTRAQDVLPAVPLLAVIKGVVLQQSAANVMTPYAQCQPPEGILSSPLLAPDGAKFLLETQPEVVRQALLAGGQLGDSIMPTNF